MDSITFGVTEGEDFGFYNDSVTLSPQKSETATKMTRSYMLPPYLK